VTRSRVTLPIFATIAAVVVIVMGCDRGVLLRVTPTMGDLHAVATSADVRLVLTKPVDPAGNTDYVSPKTITCAEPSPDMARIVSQALGESSSFSLKGKMPSQPTAAQLNATMALSKSHAEAIAQMTERLATIQLLRDGLYRACEAYSNGAISATTYAVILSRFDKMMVTMLFGELAAGNFGRPLATLAGTAAGKAEADLIFSATTTLPPVTSTTTTPASTTTTTQQQSANSPSDPSVGSCDTPVTPTTLAPESTTTTTTTMSTTTTSPKRRSSSQPSSSEPNQKSQASTKATTSATPAGKIEKYPSDAVQKISGDLVQMQANYLNDQNADALKVACLSSLGREPIRSNDGRNEPVRPERVIIYDQKGCPRRHTVYRYPYTRALSVVCDEFLESLKRSDAATRQYNMQRQLPIAESLPEFFSTGSKNAIGPLTPAAAKPPEPQRKPPGKQTARPPVCPDRDD
jgi:hypothetical protein